MTKIPMKSTLVEIDGDEMTRVIWAKIKEHLLEPWVDLDLERYDLSLEERDRTGDQVTLDAARAIEKHGVGVKCATITPDAECVERHGLEKAWPSPNGTIRAYLDGTIFRKPIMVRNVPPMMRRWKKPITVARHAYGDIFKNVEMAIDQPGRVEMTYTPASGAAPVTLLLHDFHAPGVVQGVHNLNSSIRSFARACISVAIEQRADLWFGVKDTISKTYHGCFREILQREVAERAAEMRSAGVSYFSMLIDDAVARSVRDEGGFIWACQNYEGDLMSDMVASGFGSLGMMTSTLVSPRGKYEFEAAHGTVTRHYLRHLRGEKTSTNPTATIFAWTGALAKRGELDGTPELVSFARALQASVLEVIEAGVATGDLAPICDPPVQRPASLDTFLEAVEIRLREKVA